MPLPILFSSHAIIAPAMGVQGPMCMRVCVCARACGHEKEETEIYLRVLIGDHMPDCLDSASINKVWHLGKRTGKERNV